MNTEILKTPEEWSVIKNVLILDPDGWRIPESPSWETPISEKEFDERLLLCTQQIRPKTKITRTVIEDVLEQELGDLYAVVYHETKLIDKLLELLT